MAVSKVISISHKVKKAVFDLQFPDEATAFRQRIHLEKLFYASILPALESVFDAYDDGRLHKLDRIEIDLGELAAEDLLNGYIERTIRAKLLEYMPAFVELDSDALPIHRYVEEALVGFLESGCWPWHVHFERIVDLEDAIQALDSQSSKELISRLIPMLSRQNIRLRLSSGQFSTSFLYWLIEMMHPTHFEMIRGTVGSALGGFESTESKYILLAVSAALFESQSVSKAMVIKEVAAVRAQLPVTAQWKILEKPEDSLEEKRSEENREIYVRHAGVALLHPFLCRYFRGLELLNSQDRFKSFDARIKAVYLLNYLVTGTAAAVEPDVVLFKFLCGLPMKGPLISDSVLSAEEKKESELLLEAVINHWTKLKSTSITGLREGFLQRDGKLIEAENGWTLIVEQRSIDVLLGYLPWGLSDICLPWLETTIHVTWA